MSYQSLIIVLSYLTLTSENMFKKHIRAWGMSKYMKAEQKDAAIASLLKEMPATHEKRKILRHARQRVKAGTLDEAC